MKVKNLLLLSAACLLTGAACVTSAYAAKSVATLAEDGDVTTYLVLTPYGRYKGDKGQNFGAPQYIENAVAYIAKVGTDLPGKDDITAPGTSGEFDHWEVYEGKGAPTTYTKVPSESKILYAIFKNTGATPIPPDPPGPGPGPGPVETETTYYLNTGGSSLWGTDNPKFAVWVFGGSGTDKFIEMTAVTGDYYSVSIDTSAYSNVIFCRVNPTKSPDWNDSDCIWNKTADLSLGTNNCYTISGWAPQGSEACPGSWGTYSM